MVTSDLRPEVEIWPFRAYAMKNMPYSRCYKDSWVIVNLVIYTTWRFTFTYYRTYF